jgi:hypothetical protein
MIEDNFTLRNSEVQQTIELEIGGIQLQSMKLEVQLQFKLTA